MVKSWMTTLVGILVLLAGALQCVHDGKLDLGCLQNLLIGAGFLAAKDYNATGGSK